MRRRLAKFDTVSLFYTSTYSLQYVESRHLSNCAVLGEDGVFPQPIYPAIMCHILRRIVIHIVISYVLSPDHEGNRNRIRTSLLLSTPQIQLAYRLHTLTSHHVI